MLNHSILQLVITTLTQHLMRKKCSIVFELLRNRNDFNSSTFSFSARSYFKSFANLKTGLYLRGWPILIRTMADPRVSSSFTMTNTPKTSKESKSFPPLIKNGSQRTSPHSLSFQGWAMTEDVVAVQNAAICFNGSYPKRPKNLHNSFSSDFKHLDLIRKFTVSKLIILHAFWWSMLVFIPNLVLL